MAWKDKVVITTVAFDPDILVALDTYRAELHRKRIHTTRAALINTAILEFLQRRREEEAQEDAGNARSD